MDATKPWVDQSTSRLQNKEFTPGHIKYKSLQSLQDFYQDKDTVKIKILKNWDNHENFLWKYFVNIET